jgi:hypothetical protein
MPDHPATDFKVEVTFDAAKGYIAIHPELPPITALSLGGLRRRIEERLIGEGVDAHLILDAVARRERDRRRAALS